MLQQLTQYLFTHHKIAIPAIGRFELHHHPAQLDFAEKLLHPPYYSIQFSRNDEVDEKQVQFLNKEFDITGEDLSQFGKSLKRKTEAEEVHWCGVGKLVTKDGKLSFQPTFNNHLLHSAEAHKVIRKEESHAVLRGEREFSSTDLKGEKKLVKKRSYFILIAEILAVLAIGYIIYHFYTNGFHPLNSGNRISIR